MTCADCGKALTKGQHDVSMRAYQRQLCPACQKSHAKLG
jgi:phage FluMu protein Com